MKIANQDVPRATVTGPLKISLALILGTASLVACNKQDGSTTAGQKVDQAMATTERKTDELQAKAQEAGREASQAIASAADAVVDKTRDIAITTKINAKLAEDKTLKATAINVDTTDGHVVLQGSAPDGASKSRATELAKAVDGVSAVDNQLTVK